MKRNVPPSAFVTRLEKLVLSRIRMRSMTSDEFGPMTILVSSTNTIWTSPIGLVTMVWPSNSWAPRRIVTSSPPSWANAAGWTPTAVPRSTAARAGGTMRARRRRNVSAAKAAVRPGKEPCNALTDTLERRLTELPRRRGTRKRFQRSA
jgi:hypothetical protein